MKKFSIIILAIMLITTLSVGLMACDIGGGDTLSGDLGKYYLVEDGELVQDSYIEFQVGGKWTDGEFSGTYKLDGTTITFFVDGEEFFGGTFSGGVLRTDIMGIEQEYRKTAPQSSIGSDQVDNKAKITAIQGGTVDGLMLNLEIGDTVEDVDLSGMITTSKDCSWQLYTSRTATAADAIVTKMIVPKNGANTFYIVVTSSDGKINRTYTLNVWKNYFATLSFYVDDVLYDTDEVLTHTTYGAGPSCSVDGYEFQGWGCQGHYVVGDASFDATLTPCQYTVAFDADGGEDVSSKTVTYDDSIWLPDAYRTGYTFLGWYYDGQLYNGSMTYTFPHNVTMIARWQINSYNVKITSADTTKGTVNDYNDSMTYGSTVNLRATTKSGYTFIGWYDGITKISDELNYTTTVPAYNVTYTAKWSKVTLDRNNTSAGTISSLTSTYKVGDSVTITASTNNGYTWLGWYDGDTKLTDELSYTFTMTAQNKTYTAKWTYYTVNTNTNLSGAGRYTSSQIVTVGNSTTLTASTYSGYTWVGWYDGDTKLTDSLSYTFTMTAENKTYTARWTYYTVTTNTNLYGAGDYTQESQSKLTVGNSMTLYASTYSGYSWVGWFDGDKKLTDSMSYKFTMTAENKTYTAKWQVKEEMSNFTFNSTSTTCSITGVKDKTVTQIVIPQYVTSIGNSAFSGCSSLTSITIPNKVTSIGSYAFSGCSNFTSIEIPNNVTSIGSGAFSGCSNLETLTIPFVGSRAGVTSSDTYQYPFGYIFGETSYTGGVATKQYYYGSSTSSETYTTYYIPSSLKSVTVTGGNILYCAFEECGSLTSITISNSVTSIEGSAFRRCGALTSITIPNCVTSIGNLAFSGCSSLKNIDLPDNLLYIDEYTFSGCSSLTSIIIPDKVRSIGYDAFGECYSLTNVTVGESVTNIAEREYDGSTQIKTEAFSSCIRLIEIYNKSKLNIVAGSELNGRIGYYAKNIYKNDGGSKLSTDANGYVIYTDGADKILAGYIGKDTDLTLPSDITGINKHAFYECSSLTSITIPSSVTSIGNYAFSYCSSLTRINFQGTKAQWNAISKGSGWNSSTGMYTIYCTDGNISK